MSSDLSKKLQKMLAEGWEVRGFQPIMEGTQVGDHAASETTGYSVLLQGRVNLAVVRLHFEKGSLILGSIETFAGAE